MNPQMNAAIPERKPAAEEISGVIERVTFHNEEIAFCVLPQAERAAQKSKNRATLLRLPGVHHLNVLLFTPGPCRRSSPAAVAAIHSVG
jgi:hypothetical protein